MKPNLVEMHVLPWPVEHITEKDSRVFFDSGVDFLHYGSLLLENAYKPRIVKTGTKGRGWVIRFKMYKPTNVRVTKKPDGSVKLMRRFPAYTTCPEYATEEEALARCYRDIYARVHANKTLFKTQAEINRANGSLERSARADKRARLDPRYDAEAKRCEAESKFQEVRRELLEQTERRSSLRPRSKRKAVTVSTPPLPTKKSRAVLKAERAAVKHKVKLDKMLQEAQSKLEYSTAQVALLKNAYAKLESEVENGEYVARCSKKSKRPIQTYVAVGVLDPAQSTDTATTSTSSFAASSSDDDVDADDPDTPDDVLTSLALASLSHSHVQHLFKQLKTVFLCFTVEMKLWSNHIACLKALCVGDSFPLTPSMNTIIKAAERARETDTSGLSKKNRVHRRTMRRWLKYWNANRSFKALGFGGGSVSW